MTNSSVSIRYCSMIQWTQPLLDHYRLHAGAAYFDAGKKFFDEVQGELTVGAPSNLAPGWEILENGNIVGCIIVNGDNEFEVAVVKPGQGIGRAAMTLFLAQHTQRPLEGIVRLQNPKAGDVIRLLQSLGFVKSSSSGNAVLTLI